MSLDPLKQDLPADWYRKKKQAEAEAKRVEMYSKIFWGCLNIALLTFVVIAGLWALKTMVKTFIVGGLL